MKKKIINSILFILLVAILMPVSIFAQHKNISVIMNQSNCDDSTSTNDFYSSVFDVDDINEMHNKLDSIFAKLGNDMEKRIKVVAFKNDSLLDNFKFKHDFDFDFNYNIDSVFNMHKLNTNDKRIDELLKSRNFKPHMNLWMFDDEKLDSLDLKEMNVQITTDSIIGDGKTIYRKKIIIRPKEGDESFPIIIQEFDSNEPEKNDKIIAFKHKEGLRHPGKRIIVERNDKRLKNPNIATNKKLVEEILLSDAEILLKGGIASKVLLAPQLKPNDVEVKIKVKDDFGKKTKVIGVSFNFGDTRDLKVIFLNKNGQVLYNETKKNFSGKYETEIEFDESTTPIYFIAIRDKKMFGRKIND